MSFVNNPSVQLRFKDTNIKKIGGKSNPEVNKSKRFDEGDDDLGNNPNKKETSVKKKVKALI